MKKTVFVTFRAKAPKKLKAFTLVELIVVMVILALLMALAVPQITKYIDKADDLTIKSEARACVTAVQAFCVEQYEENRLTDDALRKAIANDLTTNGSWVSDHTHNPNSKIYKMANVPENGNILEISPLDIEGTTVKKLMYQYNLGPNKKRKRVIYENGKYRIETVGYLS